MRRVGLIPGVVMVALLTGGCAHRTPPSYSPASVARTHAETGQASWYGKAHQGERTASGESYDMHALTAAHRTLPFGAIVRVTVQRSGKFVDVRINDRGPFHQGRIIDLSYEAARELGIISGGTARVEIKVIGGV